MANFPIAFMCLIFVEAFVCYNVDFQSYKTYQGRKGSYFGYDVELVPSSDLLDRRILVGAPKDITSYDKSDNEELNYKHKMTGSLYVCSSSTDCRRRMSEVMLDRASNLKGEGQMLGASIVVQNNTTIVCAPRWVHRQYNDSDWLKGRCVEGENLSFKRKINLMGGGEEQVEGQVVKGMAASGFSITILLDGAQVFGVPGYKAFSGGFVIMTKNNETVFYPTTDPSSNDLSGYMGYALTVGDFKGTFGRDQYIVAGIPRLNDKGAVKLFEYDRRNNRVVERAVLSGKQISSYYGASLCAVDLDDDGLDDLIVGAPSYYDQQQNIEIGRVYVHKNTYYRRRPNFKAENTIILSGDADFGSRFGSSISNLGDINHDGVPDIAIGAPFEQNGKGAVYIFNIDFANKIGKRIQKLTVARSRGFGFHISKGLDMDGNLYADFAVGAFLSDEVHLFYTRNTIQLGVDFTISPPRIEQGDSKVNFTICMKASDVNRRSNDTLSIDYVLTMDTEKDNSRLTIFTNQGYQRKVRHQLIIQSQNPNPECTSYLILHRETQDVFSPIQVTLSAEISNKTQAQPIPMLAKSVFNYSIRYEIKCEDEQRCIADLDIQLHSVPDIIIFNKTSIVDIRVNITNKAEPASATVANVTVTGSAVYKRVTTIGGKDVQCTQTQIYSATTNKQFTLQCYVSNWLVEGGVSVFDLTLDVSQMKNNNEHELSVTSITTSDSEEKIGQFGNNKAELFIPIKHETSITIEGTSQPEQMTYTKGSKRHYLMNHEYNIWNNGPSSLLPTSVHFKIPFKRDVITEISHTDHKVSNCTVVGDKRYKFYHGRNTAFPATISSTSTESSTTTRTTTSSTTEITTPMKLIPQRKRRLLDSYAKISPNEKRTVISCEGAERFCTRVQCKLYHISSETEVKIIFKINFTTAEQLDVSSNNDMVVIETEGVVEEPKTTRHVKWNLTVNTTIETVLYPSIFTGNVRGTMLFMPTSGKIPVPLSWIVILSVAGGVVIDIVIFGLCYSLGFFKRKKKQKVETWKRQSGYYEHKRNSRLSSSRNRSLTRKSGSHKSSVQENEEQVKCDLLED